MKYDRNISLKNYNSFRTESRAKLFCQPTNITDILECLNKFPDEKKLVLGGGCNLFFTSDYDGLVIYPQLKGIREIDQEENNIYIEAMASEEWDNFVEFCVGKNYWGLENLSRIPGTVGASPVQNIGAYGAEVKDCIEEVKTIDMETGKITVFTNEACKFAYRDSIFKQCRKYIITSVVFKFALHAEYTPKYKELNEELKNISTPSLRNIRNAVITIRERKLPDERKLPNGGSFFKNPTITPEQYDELKEKFPELPAFPREGGQVKTSAAFLIDKAGYKGVKKGYIGTYPLQPLIIVNYGTSDGKEIVHFMEEIKEKVKSIFSIELEPEIRII